MNTQQQHGGSMYQAGSGYGMQGQSRDGVSAGYGFHSQKVGDKVPSLRNGVESYDRTIVRPTTNVTGSNATGEVTFDWTSANNRWWVPSQTLLTVQLNVAQAAVSGNSAEDEGAVGMVVLVKRGAPPLALRRFARSVALQRQAVQQSTR